MLQQCSGSCDAINLRDFRSKILSGDSQQPFIAFIAFIGSLNLNPSWSQVRNFGMMCVQKTHSRIVNISEINVTIIEWSEFSIDKRKFIQLKINDKIKIKMEPGKYLSREK